MLIVDVHADDVNIDVDQTWKKINAKKYFQKKRKNSDTSDASDASNTSDTSNAGDGSKGKVHEKKVKNKLTSVSFAFTHTYTLKKLTLFLFSPSVHGKF